VNGSGVNVAGCASCAGRCCRSYRVEVTVTDVRTLAAGTAMHPRDFIRLREDGRNTGFRLRPDGPTMELNLVRRPHTGGCVFLMEIAPDVARCGVYAHRPLVCSNFPTTVRHGAVGIRQNVTCAENSWNLAAMDLGTYRRGHVRSVAAWAEHWQTVRAWNSVLEENSREATEEDLYEFLLSHPSAPA
jgi:Fe-S-cluster containining protein